LYKAAKFDELKMGVFLAEYIYTFYVGVMASMLILGLHSNNDTFEINVHFILAKEEYTYSQVSFH